MRRVNNVLTIVSSSILGALLLEHSVVVVVADLEAEASGVDVAVAPKEEGAEDGLGEEVEDAIEDGFAVGGDDVAALAETPGNGVQDPEECGERAAHQKGALDVAAKGLGVDAGFPGELEDDVEEGDTTKDKEWPLVDALDESANQASHDHDFVDEDDPENGGPWHTGGKQQVHEKQRCSDEPVHVTSIVDGAVGTTNDWIAAAELDFDRREAEVGAHGEVGNGCNKDDTTGDVVEDTVAALNTVRHGCEDEACHSHDGTDGEVEVGAMSGQTNVCSATVDSVAIVFEHIVSAFKLHCEKKL